MIALGKNERGVDAYLRDIIAPLIFPNGFHEKNEQLYGTCPKCKKSEESEHCSICVKSGKIVGSCFACKWAVSDYIADNPANEQFFSGYEKHLKEATASENGVLEREHFYTSVSGKVLYRKQIYRKANGKKHGVWATALPDGVHFDYGIPSNKHAPIYHLDEIESEDRDPQKWIYVCEGEKDADNIRSLMRSPATCFPNGAISSKTKVHSDWLDPFAGQRVVVMGDNDNAGIESAETIVKRLIPVALVVKQIMPTDLLGLPFNEIANKKKGYDVSDFIEEVGQEAAYQTIKRLTDEILPASSDDYESDALPEWLIKREWQGRTILRIDEPKFAEVFQEEYKVTRINGVFYKAGEEVQDDLILMLIQSKIAVYFKENTGKLTREVFNTMANAAYTSQPDPDESKIYCRNGITINVLKDGTFETVEEDIFTLTRIGADYDGSADCPTFLKYLNDLFYEEDIPAVQEYFGYCLIPCTRAQAGMFIKGKGGEGKSVLRDVIMALFGKAAIQEYVHELGERFTIANLENKLVVIDDDLQTDLLKDTSTLKKLITARERFQVERKLKTKYDAYLYARILAIGNTFIGSKFDHSDGFYRRQLLIDVKPKTREEKDDDRFMSDKCVKELSGILNWALEGLSRLIQNNYHFTVSERMARTLDSIKHDGDNSLTFIEDDIYIEITKDPRDVTTTADLFMLYAVWCADNGDTPIKRKSFQRRMAEHFNDYKTRIRSTEGNLQGYKGIRLTDHAEARLSRITEKERERIIRLP